MAEDKSESGRARGRAGGRTYQKRRPTKEEASPEPSPSVERQKDRISTHHLTFLPPSLPPSFPSPPLPPYHQPKLHVTDLPVPEGFLQVMGLGHVFLRRVFIQHHPFPDLQRQTRQRGESLLQLGRAFWLGGRGSEGEREGGRKGRGSHACDPRCRPTKGLSRFSFLPFPPFLSLRCLPFFFESLPLPPFLPSSLPPSLSPSLPTCSGSKGAPT